MLEAKHSFDQAVDAGSTLSMADVRFDLTLFFSAGLENRNLNGAIGIPIRYKYPGLQRCFQQQSFLKTDPSVIRLVQCIEEHKVQRSVHLTNWVASCSTGSMTLYTIHG